MTILSASCAPSQESLQIAIAGTISAFTPLPSFTPPPPYPTHTSYPTYTLAPTYTPLPTLTAIIRVVTATSPPYTVTITPTPTQTGTATPTTNRTQTEEARAAATLQAIHGPGFYLVGVDIAPGIWRSSSTLDSCYWARLTRTGDIIDNYFGYGGSTIYIATTDFAVEFDADCGSWSYLSPP